MKHPVIENMLDNLAQKMFGTSRKDGCCVSCGNTKVFYDDFNDDISRREYDISKLCQKCQDSVFAEAEDD